MKNYIFSSLIVLFLMGCQGIEERSDAYGNFEATTVTVSSETPGKIQWLAPREGSSLTENAQVGLIDTALLHLQRLQLKAQLKTLPQQLQNSLADIEVLRKQRSNVLRERDRVQRLVAKKAATTKQLDDLNGQIEVIDRQIEAIRSKTNTANRGILSQQEPLFAQINLIEEQILKAQITNPIHGVVLTRIAEPGEFVNPGSPLYRIANLDTMTVRFYVSGPALEQLKLGQLVEVLTDAPDGGLTAHQGRIAFISSEAEFTPKTIQTKEDRVNLVYAVEAKVANKNERIKIGMPAEINFSSRLSANKKTPNE